MSCRQLSPHLALALLLVLCLLLPRPVSAATTVQSIAVTTDRLDYVNVPGMNQVTATARVDFAGNGPIDPVRFDWFDPGASIPFRSAYIAPGSIGVGSAGATDAWVAGREGVGFTVVASINITAGGGPIAASAPAAFNVYNRTQIIVVTNVVVTTSPVYENGTVASARADMRFGGNSSLLAGVRFDWFYPDWSPAFTFTDPNPVPVSNDTAIARSNWTIDREGPSFHVNATYTGSSPATNTTSFDVLRRQVNTWLPIDTLSGRTILDLASSPWGVCRNTTVSLGAQLVIEAGVEIRFCKDTGLFVNGTLLADALPTKKVYFLSYVPAGDVMRAGDWRGITFFPAAPSNGSILSNTVIQAVTDGVTARGTAVTVVNSAIALASGAAVSLTDSPSLIGNNVITQAGVGVRADWSNGVVIDSNRIVSSRVGIRLQDCVASLAANDISLSSVAGLEAIRTSVSVDGGTFRDNGDTSVFLSAVPDARLRALSVSGGNDSLRGENSRNVLVELSTLTGARSRSVIFINVTSTFINTTLAALQYDLVLVASPTTFLNSTYSSLYPLVNSVLTVRNFLHVVVESNLPARPRIAGAWVNVSSDGVAVANRRTNAGGWSFWIVLTDRVMDSTRTRPVENIVDVHAQDLAVDASPRTVSMERSHYERFLVSPLAPNPGGFFLGIDAILLLLLVVVMGTVLLAMPAMRRRRDAPPERPTAAFRAVALEPGVAYLLPDAKPDRAFQMLGEQVRRGVKGLVVTRIYPEEARRRYGLGDLPVLWLSRGYGKDTVNPTNLGALVQEIERFVSGKEDSIVLIDGLEYLLVQNETQKVVKFIQSLADTASVHRSKVLLPFNTKTVAQEAQRALLTRELVEI